MKRTKMARSHNNDNDNDDHLDERAPLLGGGGGSNRPTIDGFDTISTNNHNNNNHCGHDDDDDDRRRREEDDDDNKSPTVADSPTTVNGNEEEEQESPTRDVAPPPPPPTSAPSTPPPVPQAVVKADMEMAWSEPAGLRVRRQNDENLIIFRRAVGINSELNSGADARSLEEGRRHAAGIYAATLQAQRSKALMYTLIQTMVYASHFLQIIVAASLTALGPTAGEHSVAITILGAMNTVVAGVLALVKGQGLPERLRQDRAEFRKLQDWIEQTEALLAVGVIGKDRKEVGLLVQIAFVKYNAAKASEENNVPENYVRAPNDDGRDGSGR